MDLRPRRSHFRWLRRAGGGDGERRPLFASGAKTEIEAHADYRRGHASLAADAGRGRVSLAAGGISAVDGWAGDRRLLGGRALWADCAGRSHRAAGHFGLGYLPGAAVRALVGGLARTAH